MKSVGIAQCYFGLAIITVGKTMSKKTGIQCNSSSHSSRHEDLDLFKEDGDALTTTDAGRADAVLLAVLSQLVHHVRGNSTKLAGNVFLQYLPNNVKNLHLSFCQRLVYLEFGFSKS